MLRVRVCSPWAETVAVVALEGMPVRVKEPLALVVVECPAMLTVAAGLGGASVSTVRTVPMTVRLPLLAPPPPPPPQPANNAPTRPKRSDHPRRRPPKKACLYLLNILFFPIFMLIAPASKNFNE